MDLFNEQTESAFDCQLALTAFDKVYPYFQYIVKFVINPLNIAVRMYHFAGNMRIVWGLQRRKTIFNYISVTYSLTKKNLTNKKISEHICCRFDDITNAETAPD